MNRRFRRLLRDAHPDSGGAARRGRGADRRAHRGARDPARRGFGRGRGRGLASRPASDREEPCACRRHRRGRSDRLQPRSSASRAATCSAPTSRSILPLLEITPALGALERRRDGARRLRVPAARRRRARPTTPTPRSTASTTRCSSAPGRARRAWSARSCSRSTARSSPTQGKALAAGAADDVRVLVVGNPANTNCLIAMNNAGSIPRERFTAMTRLDHNRAKAQLAAKVRRAGRVGHEHDDLGQPLRDAVPRRVPRARSTASPRPSSSTRRGSRRTFIPTVQQRGAAIIEARGASSAASAANAALDHVRDWALGTAAGDWVSMAVLLRRLLRRARRADLGLPVHDQGRRVVDRARPRHRRRSRAAAIDASVAELGEERDAVAELGLI